MITLLCLNMYCDFINQTYKKEIKQCASSFTSKNIKPRKQNISEHLQCVISGFKTRSFVIFSKIKLLRNKYKYI